MINARINGYATERFHGVRFHRSDHELCALVTAFLVAGISKGQPALVLATSKHRGDILNRLSAGIDISQLERDGLLVSLDATETLDRLLVNDRIDRRLFEDTMSPVLKEVSQNGARPVRIYGEMVDLLWQRSLRTSAAQLEVYTNQMARHQHLLTLCGYHASGFSQDRRGAAHVCGFHTHILSDHWDESLIRPLGKPLA